MAGFDQARIVSLPDGRQVVSFIKNDTLLDTKADVVTVSYCGEALPVKTTVSEDSRGGKITKHEPTPEGLELIRQIRAINPEMVIVGTLEQALAYGRYGVIELSPVMGHRATLYRSKRVMSIDAPSLKFRTAGIACNYANNPVVRRFS